MKKLCFLLQTLLLLSCSFFSFGQTNIKIAPKLISFKQSRFSLGVGGEAGLMVDASKTSNLNIVYKDPRDTSGFSIPYTSYGFVFDLYSANSIIGILGGLDFSNSKFGLKKGDTLTDYFNISRVEIPLYLKFRFGAANGTKHLLLLLGGIYSIPQNCKREQFNPSQGSSATTILEDDSKDQLNSYFALSGQLGYEFFLEKQKHFRMAFYSSIVYPIKNEFNTNYTEFKLGGNGVLGNSPNFDIRECRISLGLRFMFQFGEALSIMASSITK